MEKLLKEITEFLETDCLNVVHDRRDLQNKADGLLKKIKLLNLACVSNSEAEMTEKENIIIKGFDLVAERTTAIAESKGWTIEPDEKSICQKILLMVTELTEATEALREGNPPDNHIPEFNGMEAEFADVILRIGHLAKRLNLRVGEAMVAKMNYNETRPYKHGGKKF